jgi:hypothetical protein
MKSAQMSAAEEPPTFWITPGRTRAGKTALLNTIEQHFRGPGNPPRDPNADQPKKRGPKK